MRRREKEKEEGESEEEGGEGGKDMVINFIHACCTPPFCCINIPSMSDCCL